MNNVTVRKAKIKDKIFLEAEYSMKLEGFSKKDCKDTISIPVHDDLLAAFKNLRKHLALLCDEVDESEVYPEFEEIPVLDRFEVRSFCVGGSDEHEGATVSGSKDGRYGAVNLNTPFTKYGSEDYPHAGDLAQDIQACVYEVEQYLFNGKRAPERQTSLEFPEEED